MINNEVSKKIILTTDLSDYMIMKMYMIYDNLNKQNSLSESGNFKYAGERFKVFTT